MATLTISILVDLSGSNLNG